MRDADNICRLIQLPIDYIGFIFYTKSPRYVGEQIDRNILDLVPRHIKKTGVFVNEAKEKVLEIALKNQLQAVQLHGDESPEYLLFLKDRGIELIKAFRIAENFDFSKLENYSNICNYFLFDTQTAHFGGSGKKFDWQILENFTLDKPFFLSGGIGAEDKQHVLSFNHPALFAIDLNSKFEIEPGLKNIGLLKEFIYSEL